MYVSTLDNAKLKEKSPQKGRLTYETFPCVPLLVLQLLLNVVVTSWYCPIVLNEWRILAKSVHKFTFLKLKYLHCVVTRRAKLSVFPDGNTCNGWSGCNGWSHKNMLKTVSCLYRWLLMFNSLNRFKQIHMTHSQVYVSFLTSGRFAWNPNDLDKRRGRLSDIRQIKQKGEKYSIC